MTQCRSFLVVAGVSCALSTGCVRISSTTIAAGAPPSTHSDSVNVFITRPPAAYSEVAVLRAHRFLVSDSKVLAALRKRAAALGANGILLLNAANAATQTHTGAGVIIGGRNNGNVIVGNATTEIDEFERAVAIRWGERQ